MKTIRLENLNTEFMRIRQYVVDLIIRSGNEPQKVPSTRKLAQMFGVSHPTALKVLRNLAGDGHLIACGNNGYLTVPGTFGSFEELKIIGLLTGDGSNVLFGLLHFRVSTPFLEEIFGRSGRFSAQHIYLQGNVENAAAIIRNRKGAVFSVINYFTGANSITCLQIIGSKAMCRCLFLC